MKEKLNVVQNRSLAQGVGVGDADCLSQILIPQKWGKKKKKSLGETLKDHFPEAKESWHSAPFNKKEHFTKHMKEYKEKPYSPLCIKTPDHTMCK